MVADTVVAFATHSICHTLFPCALAPTDALEDRSSSTSPDIHPPNLAHLLLSARSPAGRKARPTSAPMSAPAVKNAASASAVKPSKLRQQQHCFFGFGLQNVEKAKASATTNTISSEVSTLAKILLCSPPIFVYFLQASFLLLLQCL